MAYYSFTASSRTPALCTSQAGALTEGDLAEIRSYQTPHSRVRLIMMAVCALFGVSMDWRSAQKLLVSEKHTTTARRDGCVRAVLCAHGLAQCTEAAGE